MSSLFGSRDVKVNVYTVSKCERFLVPPSTSPLDFHYRSLFVIRLSFWTSFRFARLYYLAAILASLLFNSLEHFVLGRYFCISVVVSLGGIV